ncbi:transposase [Streptomyces sp. R33]|uniref:Transposase n=1 Tax=Streptomyces sp. R33 TaxID=3238629 RepID=A0AB39YGS4_9ACTN
MFEAEPVEAKRPQRRPAAVDKTFRAFDPHQVLLPPPSLDDWLPEGHLARFVADLVDDVLDLGPVPADYTEKRGYPPYDPRLMLRLLIYGYTTGVRSSRAIERKCVDDVAFRFLAADQAPDFRSIARFRRRHLDALADLFLQSLRLARLQAARAQIEAEAAAKARKHAQDKERRRQDRTGTSDEQAVTDAGEAAAAKARPKPKAQANFTDPDSRIMKNGDGAYIQSYNAQAVVDEQHQAITAADVTTNASDALNYTDMLDQSARNTGTHPKQALVDAGYCSNTNLEAARDRHLSCGTDTFVATGRLGHDEQVPPAPRGRIPTDATLKERMARKLRTKPGRKAIVDPVFGQIMTCQNGRQLLLRGEDGARGEWRLLAACHNFRKAFRHAGTAGLAAAVG